MIEHDTIRLLRECDAGVKMGISSIDDVIDNVKSEDFRQKLSACKEKHEDIECKIRTNLKVGTRVRLYGANCGFFALGEVREYENGTAIKAIKTFSL